MHAVRVFLLGTIVANNLPISDVPASCLGYVLLYIKEMVSMVVARHQIYLQNNLLYTSLYFGHFNRWQYSRRSPVLLTSAADAKLQRNCSGNLRDAACPMVKGCAGVSTSTMWNRKSSVMVLPLCWWRVLVEAGLTDSWSSWDTTRVCRVHPMSLSGYSISRSGKEMVGLAVGAALGVLVGVRFGSALVSTLSV